MTFTVFFSACLTGMFLVTAFLVIHQKMIYENKFIVHVHAAYFKKSFIIKTIPATLLAEQR